MEKANQSADVIRYVQSLIGGGLHHRPRARSDRWQLSTSWFVGGKAARDFAQQIAPYLHLKKQQANILSGMRVGKLSYTIKRDDDSEQRHGLSRAEAAAILGVSRLSTISERCTSGAPLKHWYIVREEDVRAEACQRLKALNGAPHAPLQTSMHPAYVAGFFDAEGHVRLSKDSCSPQIDISQKWPPIVIALQQQYGGTVLQGDTSAAWRIYGQNARRFLLTILPHLVEKRQQVILCLSADKHSYKQHELEMKMLRGKQLE